MHPIKNEWADGSDTMVGLIESNPWPHMTFYHNNEQVAFIDKNGNLNIHGNLIENCDPKKLMLVHQNKNAHLWPNPVVYYEEKQVTAVLVQDINTGGRLNTPGCFWNETDFFVWGELGTNVPGPSQALLTLEPFEIPEVGVYTKMSIRGTVVQIQKEPTKDADEANS